MNFEASDFLTRLFGAKPGAPAAAVPEALQPEVAPAADTPQADLPDWLAEHEADGFARWDRRQDARGVWGWERADLPVVDWDHSLEPTWSCPDCGGPLWWEDLLGGRHCLRCETAGRERTLRLADRAVGLRSRTTAQQPARCEKTTPADIEHVPGKRPSGAILEGSDGCQVGQLSDTNHYDLPKG